MNNNIIVYLTVLFSLCFLTSRNIKFVVSHNTRPGTTRKSPREILQSFKNSGKGIISGYYPSWRSYHNGPISSVSPDVNVLFFAFGKMEMKYTGSDSAFSTNELFEELSGIQYNSLQNFYKDMITLRKARPDIIIILSLGGDNPKYNPTTLESALNNVETILDFVDDMGFDGIDLDYEPGGAFEQINTNPKIAEFYVEYANKFRQLMCPDKLLSISTSSNGALSCLTQIGTAKCSDPESTHNTTYLSGPSVHPDIKFAANMASTGTAIHVIQSLKEKLDIIFVQTYNLNTCKDPMAMVDLYDSYLYYGKKYDINIQMGFTLMEPSTPFNASKEDLIQKLGNRIRDENKKNKRADGMGFWALVNGGFVSETVCIPLIKKHML